MRDNVSIIFAAIFAVVLLIVFPLFSLLTRQDNIAYNKVLTITTEFVDSVRTKGYFTEDDYTNYLVKLAATQNTYKVDMECHKKMLIKDVNKYTESNPIWIEDTAVYYNSYVENELKNSNVVVLEEGDEFYIKLYNTNITTASLMYNSFLNSKIPRKVINIGYGGKVLNSTGDTFVKTTFNSLYTPYVTFGEVVNKNEENFKYCYDQEAGTYEMQSCDRIVDIDNKENDPIKVNFKLNNFSKIGDRDLSAATFEDNKEYFIDMIKENIVLRGDYISSYDLEIEELKYVADRVEGTISIRNIILGSGALRTTAYIVIGSNLGTGPTGAASSEGTTAELTLTRMNRTSNFVIAGPYISKSSDFVVTETLANKETVYYKVSLKDMSDIKKLELFDTQNAETIATYDSVKDGDEFTNGVYNIKIEKTKSYEYWISITPTYELNEDAVFNSVSYELQLVVYADEYVDLDVTSEEVKFVSKVAVWRSTILKLECQKVSVSKQEGYVRVTFNRDNYRAINSYIKDMKKQREYDEVAFFTELVKSQVIYTAREDTGEKKGIEIIKVSKDTTSTTGYYNIYYKEILNGAPAKTNLIFNFDNLNGTIKTCILANYVNIPNGYTASSSDGLVLVTKDDMDYYWIPANESDVLDTNAYYDSSVTRVTVKDSIRKYGGFYVAKKWANAEDSDFSTVWEDNKGENTSQLFSSLIYEWQLNKIYELFGSGTSIATQKIEEGFMMLKEDKTCEFWLAENRGSNNFKAAHFDSSENIKRYVIKTYAKSDKRGSFNTKFAGLQVLYIK